MTLPVVISGISTAVAPVGPFKATNGNYYFIGRDGTTATTLQAYKASAAPATIYTIATNTTTNTNGAFGDNASSARLSQSFDTGASDLTITSVTFAMSKTGSPTDNIKVDLYLFDTGAVVPTGATLGTTAVIAGSTLTASMVKYTFTFATPISISPNTKYAVAVSRSGAVDAANYYRLFRDSITSNKDTNQVSNFFNSTSSTWTSFSNIDFDLTVTGTNTPPSPDVSWSSIATRTGFTTGILNIAGYQVGNVIHLLVQDGTMASSVATKYLSFDAATDTFLTTTETVAAAQALTGQATAGWGGSLVVRSNGNVVLFYNSLQTKTGGTFRARVNYRERTGLNTYGTETSVDGGAGATDSTTPIAVLGATNRVHFFWSGGATNTGYRTLSAANAQNTAGSSASMAGPGDGVSYDRSGTIKVVVTNNTNGAQNTARFDSSDNPTPTFANQSIAAATIPHRIGVDISNDEVTIAYRSSADSDLYAIKSTDDGATFGSPASLFVGTVANADANVSRSSSGSMYQRGSNFVVGYIVNDNGTLKYNEYVIRAVSTNKTLTADGGSYLLTGTTVAAVLLKRKIDATTAASYALTGTDVTIAKGVPPKRLTADPGSYALTGASTTTILRRARIDATTGSSYAITGASTTTVLHKAKIDATVGGAYALTGTTTSLLHKYRPVALGGSYLLTGTDAALTKLAQRTLAAGTASYALTGTDTAIVKRTFRRLTADGGSYAVTGAATSAVVHKWKITADAASYALTGNSATFLIHRDVVSAAPGAYALTGNATAVLLHRWKVAATGGSYALSGNSATFLIHKDIVSAAPGAYALTGSAVAFQIRSDKFVSAASGVYALTGTAVTMRRIWKHAATAGSYAITGNPATALTKLSQRTLAAASGSYALTGTATAVLHRWKTAALGGSYAITGSPATVRYGYKVPAGSSSYALAGTAATVRKTDARTITALAASYALTGTAASARRSLKLFAPIGGTYALTGDPARPWHGYKVLVGAASYALTGAAATLSRLRKVVTAEAGAYALTGKPALVLYRWTLPAAGSSYAVTGTPAILRRVRTITAAPAAYALTGKPAIINKVGLLYLVAEPASYEITGNVARIFTGEWGISAGRTVLAVAEDRTVEVMAETRVARAVGESRMVRVPAEVRMVSAIEEFRTIQAKGESHGVSQMERQGRGRAAGLQHRLVATAD